MKTESFKMNIFSYLSTMLLTCLLLFCQTLDAQETKKSREEEAAEKLTEMMDEKLSLDDQQSKKIYDINLKYINMNEQLQNSSARRISKLKTLKSNQEAKEKELKSILTDEQYNEYQRIKTSLREEFKENLKNKEQLRDYISTVIKKE